MVSKFRAGRPLRRRAPYREPLPRILIVCEGTKTEPKYFNEFRLDVRNLLVEIEIDDEGGVPKTLVERAAQRKKEAQKEAKQERDDNLKFDHVWCVFDIDEHPNVADARQQARDHEICLAISNPSFELWLLLHFRDHSAHIDRHDLAAELRRFIPGYKKYAPYKMLKDGYADAVRRARQIEKRGQAAGDEYSNPTSCVYRLTELITNPNTQE